MDSSAGESQPYPMSEQCLAFGTWKQFYEQERLGEWLEHVHTHLRQHSFQIISQSIEGNNDCLQWSGRPGIEIHHKDEDQWNLCSVCGSLDPSDNLEPPISSMHSSDDVSSCPSLTKYEIFSNKSLPTCTPTTDSVPGAFGRARSPRNHEVEHASRSDLLDAIEEFSISWFSAWLADRPGTTGLNSASESIHTYNGANQGEPSQAGKRKPRGQRDKDRGDRKARRLNAAKGDEHDDEYDDDEDDDDDDDDDDGNGGAPTAECVQSILDARKPLACPFHKRDPLFYGHGKFGVCATGIWTTYHRVRDHIRRKHLRPRHLCERCFAAFRNQAGLQRHSALQCIANENDPYLSSTDWERLRAARIRNKPDDEKWKQMYHVLFPNEEIPNPYKGGPACNEHVRELASEIESILLTTANAAQDQLQAISDIISLVRDAILSASGTARDVMDFHTAVANAFSEPSCWLEEATDILDVAQYQTERDFLNFSADCPDTTSFRDDQTGSGLLPELENPSDATNDGVGYQIGPWASNTLSMFSSIPFLYYDQVAPGPIDERGQDQDMSNVSWTRKGLEEFPEGTGERGQYPDMTDVAWTQKGSEEFPEGTDEGGQYQDMTDVAWTQKGSEEFPDGTDDAEHQDGACGD
ncbi:hypothetical protein M419DRAFT_71321 [Trichoderma reesei RUT C-30]|uniref:C2H2-type domain-containing protein n=1 Tax=Hypocrea jecorina (strain ATCC 56765 / BCRC 32924 / NRRL 11460 / Rut C-30) TaxID=1344414 RepID=A0A024SJ93_HYPJR|nr:hypothetical protein M419DRAFT_71321 [Trichoderma reesei RUT C-30]